MGYINSSGIYVYEESDILAPIHTSLNLLGSSVTEKLADYDAALPQFHTKAMSGAVAISDTTSFEPLAGTSLAVTLPRKAQAKIYFNTWGTISSFASGTVDLRAGVAVSGATVLEPTVGVPGGANNWGGVIRLRSGSSGTQDQQSSTRLVELNAGVNTFSIAAYKSSSAVSMSLSYGYYIVEIIRWLD